MSYLYIFLLSVMVFTIYSCNKNDKNSDNTNWEQDIIKARQDKDREFKTSPVSPFAGHARLTAPNNQTSYLAFDNGIFNLERTKSKSTLISVSQRDDKWILNFFD